MKSNQKPNGRDPRAVLAIESTPRQEGYASVLVHLVGETPLLMHRPDISGYGRKKGKGFAEIPTAEVEAEKSLYWTLDRSSLAVPSQSIERALVRACTTSGAKVGKVSLKPLIAGGLNVYPSDIPLGTKEYEVDVRQARVQGQGVLRARPKIWPWDLWLTVEWREDDFPKDGFVPRTLKDFFGIAGVRIGILDFRPEKAGKFGKFRVESITQVEQAS